MCVCVCVCVCVERWRDGAQFQKESGRRNRNNCIIRGLLYVN